MDEDTFSNDSVVTEMSDMLVFSVDTESEAGAPLAERFNVSGLPNLLFLDSNGSVRDVISGYMPPEPFIAEVQRIKRNEGTVSAQRALVELNPDDLDARYAFAEKLKSLGDVDGAAAQYAEIKARDPEGKSLASRRIAFGAVAEKVGQDLDPAPLYELAKTETEPELLFQIWYMVWSLEGYLSKNDELSEEERAAAQVKWLAAGHSVWANVATDDAAAFGNSLAWSLWLERDTIDATEKAFALEVAARSAKDMPEDASTLDTYACVLFMNGRKAEALEAINTAIRLDPENEEWQARLELFNKG
ncbi:MAG: tetratricopeptide (TPR) repeat protein [Planctomycetota bacterium]